MFWPARHALMCLLTDIIFTVNGGAEAVINSIRGRLVALRPSSRMPQVGYCNFPFKNSLMQ